MCHIDLDVGFIIDGSGSVRDANPPDGSFDNWNLVLEFVAGVINQLPRSGTRVGAVVFSDTGELLIRLNQFSSLESVRDSILTTVYPGANTNTSGGLWVARNELFNRFNGDRSEVANLAIVITDGKSTYDSDKTIPIAQDLQRDGVRVISVGITPSVDEEELRAISSPPQIRNENYFISADFTELTSIIERLLTSACVTTAAPTTTTTVTTRPTTLGSTTPSSGMYIQAVL